MSWDAFAPRNSTLGRKRTWQIPRNRGVPQRTRPWRTGLLVSAQFTQVTSVSRSSAYTRPTYTQMKCNCAFSPQQLRLPSHSPHCFHNKASSAMPPSLVRRATYPSFLPSFSKLGTPSMHDVPCRCVCTCMTIISAPPTLRISISYMHVRLRHQNPTTAQLSEHRHLSPYPFPKR
jgi:hypothetical protein